MTAPVRAVVALDVDGVLNPAGEVEGFLAHFVHVPADQLPTSPFIRGHGRTDLEAVVRLNATHGSWITAMRARADVVWATTWEHAANTHLAPLLGIDPLEVATAVAAHPPLPGDAASQDSSAWKAQVLADRYPGRPLAWIDDTAWRYVSVPTDARKTADRPDDQFSNTQVRVWRHPDPTLILAPDPREGLTAEHIARIESFVDQYADEPS